MISSGIFHVTVCTLRSLLRFYLEIGRGRAFFSVNSHCYNLHYKAIFVYIIFYKANFVTGFHNDININLAVVIALL